jgi:hypothetical protein
MDFATAFTMIVAGRNQSAIEAIPPARRREGWHGV